LDKQREAKLIGILHAGRTASEEEVSGIQQSILLNSSDFRQALQTHN